MSEQRRIAVAGATGRVGSHVVDVLADQGHEVVAMSRSRGVDVITAEGLGAGHPGPEGHQLTGGMKHGADSVSFPTSTGRAC